MNPRRLGSGPLIANLTFKHRMSVNEAMRAGRYGPTFLRDGVRYVELDAIECLEGLISTDEQLALATDGQPGRLLTIPENEKPMARKPNTAAQIADCNLGLKDLADAIAGLRRERQAKLLADVDDGREPEAKEIEEKIRALAVEAEGLREKRWASIGKRARREAARKAAVARWVTPRDEAKPGRRAAAQ